MTAAVGARNFFKVDAGVVHALLQARYYDGSKGEFLSEDPVFLGDPRQQVLTDPQSLNSYSYANDNPITKSDEWCKQRRWQFYEQLRAIWA
jgi:RHS repeat-associated protein